MNRLYVSAAVAIATASGAQAQVVFSTFGPGQSFPDNFFYRLSAPTVERLGWRFSPSQSGLISNVIAPINSFPPVVTGRLELSRVEGGGGAPGTLLGTLETLLPQSGFFPPRLATFLPTAPIQILEGESYYLTLVRTPPRTLDWFATGPAGPLIEQIYQASPGAPWEVTLRNAPVFSVSIPAPTCGTSLLILAIGAPRRRR